MEQFVPYANTKLKILSYLIVRDNEFTIEGSHNCNQVGVIYYFLNRMGQIHMLDKPGIHWTYDPIFLRRHMSPTTNLPFEAMTLK